MKFISDWKIRLALWKSNRQMREVLRARGFIIYKRRKPAIRKAKALTKQFRIVYWVMKESIGYYVLNLDNVKRLDKNELKRGGKKIKHKDLDATCEWRSPFYNTL